MDAPLRVTSIAELVSPFLDDGLFLVLWNTMATARARATVEETVVPDIDTDAPEDEDRGESTSALDTTRQCAAALANLVLQERVRLVCTFWQALSSEEQKLLLQMFQSSDARADGAKLQSVLRALEETYLAEQIHHQRQATQRSLLLQPVRPSDPSDSDALGSSSSSGGGAAHRRPTTTVRKRLMSNFAFMNHHHQQQQRQHTPHGAVPSLPAASEPQEISIPNVLLGVIRSQQSARCATTLVAASETLSPDELRGAHESVLRTCERIFDLLCDDDDDESDRVDDAMVKHQRPQRDEPQGQEPLSLVAAPVVSQSSRDSHLDEARRALCDLLCAHLAPSTSFLDALAKSEAARERQRRTAQERGAGDASIIDGSNTSALVQTIIQRQKQNPSLLVSAINQSPEILLSAVAQNLGILRFAITKFAGPVKRFLRLDAKACDHLDALVQKNRGVQLLWGTHASGADSAIGVGASSGDEFLVSAGAETVTTAAGGSSYLVDWFTSHTTELSALFLNQPELLKQLFVDMHEHADVSSFYRLMLQLQTARGVQNFMRRASVATLERIAQEDPSEILRLLRDVFHEDASGPNRDLLDQLRSSQYLVTCLGEFHPTALQDILSSHIDTWKHYFVDTAASNDAILRESLLLRVRLTLCSSVLC